MPLTARWMLDYLGFEGAAERPEKALYDMYAEGRPLTPHQGGSASTTEFCEAAKANL